MFLQSDKHCKFDKNSPCVTKAKEFAAEATSNTETVAKCMAEIKRHCVYDYMRAFNQKTQYNADIDGTWNNAKGICLDFAGVLAAMCRSVGIPTKIVIGYADGKCHAWNSIKLQGKWTRYDATAAITNKKFLKYISKTTY